MIETVCKIEDKFQRDNKDFFKLVDRKDNESYVVPLSQLFDDNLFIGSEYKFYKQYNSKLEKHFLIQEHPYYRLNKQYEFPIIRKELYSQNNGIEAFVLTDNNKNEIRIKPLATQRKSWDKETLTCQVVAYSKKGLRLKNVDFSNMPYEIGEIYDFEIVGFGEYINNKEQAVPSVILKNFDGTNIDVTAFKWQTKENWKFPTLSCEVIRYNYEGIPLLRNRDERHPIYEVGNEYDFKVKGLKIKSDPKNSSKKYDVIELIGQDGFVHETNALPGQMRSLQAGDDVQCIVQSIGYNLRLNQINIKDPYFSKINEIVKDNELITKYFNKAISDEENIDSVELANKYNSSSAFWVFTFCNKILTRYFKESSERYDYKSSKQIAELIITIENWIIKNGIITSFPNEETRKNTTTKAKQQLAKFLRIKEILTILEGLDLSEFFNKEIKISTKSDIEDLYYILLFSDIERIDVSEFHSYLKSLLEKLDITEEISYSLNLLDKSIQQNKKVYYSDEYEKSFNLSFSSNKLFENDSHRNKYLTLSFCQYLINEKQGKLERANYILGRILRQLFYSTGETNLKEKLLFNAYYYQNNQSKVNAHPFKYTNELLVDEEKLYDNPNCCVNQDNSWEQIKLSYDTKQLITVNVIRKEFNGFVVDYNGIKGFVPYNHIHDRKLKHFSFSKIDFTITVACILISEEFNFYIAKQPPRDTDGYLCRNNLFGKVKVGDIVDGKIKSIEKYGVFITSYWGDGLLHVKNISNHLWDKDRLQSYFRSGDKITVKVVSIEGRRIGLSLIDLIDTYEEDKYFDFINYIDFGEVFTSAYTESHSENILNDEEYRFNQLEKAFCFEQYAMLRKRLEDKIHYLRLSKQFFSSVSNPRSYLINIYTNYFKLLTLIEDAIEVFSIQKLEKIKSEAQNILEKVKQQEQTLEVYPDSKKLIFFINIISLFNDTSDTGINTLYELLQKNSKQKILKTIAKITLANNLLISESEENTDFVRKNLRHIKSYLDDGVLSLKETEDDKREREIREKVIYWTGRIQEDESESQEFKSTFRTPLPDNDRLKEKDKLLKLLESSPKKDGLLKKIDAIDGDLASKIVIHSSLKTLCAFANTNGGTLLIGVGDDKSIIGLEKDYVNLKNKQNRDGFGLFFDDKIKEYFEPSFSSLLERDFLKFPEGDILIVKVKQSVDPIFLLKGKDGKACEELYVRDLTSTKEIKEKRELVKFVKQKEKEQIKIKIDE